MPIGPLPDGDIRNGFRAGDGIGGVHCQKAAEQGRGPARGVYADWTHRFRRNRVSIRVQGADRAATWDNRPAQTCRNRAKAGAGRKAGNPASGGPCTSRQPGKVIPSFCSTKRTLGRPRSSITTRKNRATTRSGLGSRADQSVISNSRFSRSTMTDKAELHCSRSDVPNLMPVPHGRRRSVRYRIEGENLHLPSPLNGENRPVACGGRADHS
jgi:hypothetical protein